MRDPQTGQRVEMSVGTETLRSSYPEHIFRKPALESELVVEATMPNRGGHKMRALYGRDADGSWRGKVEDIGHVSENSPYTYIRILDDQQISLRDATEIMGEQADSYETQVDHDKDDSGFWDEADLYKLLSNRLQQLQGNIGEMKKDFASGMQAFFGDDWQRIAQELFPGRV